ncbi:MAG: hypothetical protein U5K28_01835 [Halobacteriales archaeon]|nr:hypothetical protein [Halobacteriales archaeon]
MSDHSLSEFTETTDDGDQHSAASDDAEPSISDAPDAPDELLATAQFFPDGALCESCSASVTRRWHDDGHFVCADCKDW